MKTYYILYILLFFISLCDAQDFSSKSLNKMGDEELLSLFDEVDTDSIKAEKVARAYLYRARKEKDTIKMARGYDRLARIFSHEKNIQYADSIIYLTKNIDNITYPGLGYMLKGYEFELLDNLKKSTDNYIKAYDLAIQNKNVPQQLYISNILIFNKSIWGNKREALKIQRKRHKIIRDAYYMNEIHKSTRAGGQVNYEQIYIIDELNSIKSFVFCYLNLKELDSARIYLDRGVRIADEASDKRIMKKFNLWFLESSIEIDYYLKDYQKAIIACDDLLLQLNIENKINSIQNVMLFKGLSLLKLGESEEGIKFLKRADSIFEINKFSITQPYQRILFEELLSHYKFMDNTEKRIKYLNKLIKADSVIKLNYQYFEPNLIKEYETPEFFKEKEELIAKLEQKNNIKSSTIGWVLGLLTFSLFFLGYYAKQQQVYKKRFNSLVSNGSKDRFGKKIKSKKEISKDIFNSILEQLDAFENNEKYLSTKISLQDLARSFGTNYNYLSRVVNINKGKSFSCYINDLRVGFAFEELKTNQRLRNYTIKALAHDCGFKSAESFSKSFFKVYKISPTFYIKELDKKQ